jgi:hypothetical protein
MDEKLTDADYISISNASQITMLSDSTESLNIKKENGDTVLNVNNHESIININADTLLTGNLILNGVNVEDQLGNNSVDTFSTQYAIIDQKSEQLINGGTNTSILWDNQTHNNITGLTLNGNKITNTTSDTMVLQVHYSFRTRSVNGTQHQINCWASAETVDNDSTSFQSQIIGQNLVISGSDNGSTTGSGILVVSPGGFIKIFCWVSTACRLSGGSDKIYHSHLQIQRVS